MTHSNPQSTRKIKIKIRELSNMSSEIRSTRDIYNTHIHVFIFVSRKLSKSGVRRRTCVPQQPPTSRPPILNGVSKLPKILGGTSAGPVRRLEKEDLQRKTGKRKIIVRLRPGRLRDIDRTTTPILVPPFLRAGPGRARPPPTSSRRDDRPLYSGRLPHLNTERARESSRLVSRPCEISSLGGIRDANFHAEYH